MKILYFTRDYTSHDHRFLSALARTEHQIYYLRLERRGHQLEDRPLPAGVEHIRWYGGGAPMSLIHGPRLLLDLRRVIRELQPDLIQAGPLQRSAFLVALTGFEPLLSMSWGYDLIFDAQNGPLWRWATRYTLKQSAMMLGDSSIIRKMAVEMGMPDEQIVTFPWGIDLEHFSPPVTNHRSNNAFTLLSTRSWEPIYGVDIIAHAFVKAARTHPELRLMMLGNGSQAAELHRIFMQGNVGGRVVFPGQVKHNDLPRYYQSADLYVSASHSDGTSISLLEAMACGCPALVSDIPGNCEWVHPGKNGWLFPDGNTEALVEAIHKAVDERQLLPDLGIAARQTAEQRANWKNNFQILLEAYDQVVG